MSARQVSQIADAQASQINYYFGSFEQMLCSAQGQALELAEQWCQARLEALSGLDESVGMTDAFGYVLAALIDDWCRNEADLAFAWTECQLLAGYDETYIEATQQWQALWTRFFDELCTRAGLADVSGLMRQFFTGEAFLHRIAWRIPLDRAVLSETCTGWVRLLLEGEASPAPLRAVVQGDTRRHAPLPLLAGSVQAQIAEAAADLVEREGAAAVTHRAVAQAAGLTLGAATYHFPSSGALLGAAWAAIYARLTRPGSNSFAPTGPVLREEYMSRIAQFFDNVRQQHDLRGMEELLSQAARDPALTGMGAMIRYSRGQSTYLTLSRLPRDGAPLDAQAAALISTWLQGVSRDLRGLDQDGQKTEMLRQMNLLLDCLRVTP
ncbi:MAG: TetR family transcriptional regulator [Asticcacaulis sp.]